MGRFGIDGLGFGGGDGGNVVLTVIAEEDAVEVEGLGGVGLDAHHVDVGGVDGLAFGGLHVVEVYLGDFRPVHLMAVAGVEVVVSIEHLHYGLASG